MGGSLHGERKDGGGVVGRIAHTGESKKTMPTKGVLKEK